LICAEFIVATVGIGGFIVLVPRTERLGGLGVGILSLWLLSREIRGLAINDRVFALPTGRRWWLPILPLGRRVKIKPGSLRELTVMSPWYGFQLVEIGDGFRTELLLFQSRGQRLRFMSVVEEICPDVPRRAARTATVGELKSGLGCCRAIWSPGEARPSLPVARARPFGRSSA
jgi:hypothetical protein